MSATPMMPVTVRRATAADAAARGRIGYEAFADLAARHHYPPEVPNADMAAGWFGLLLGHPGYYTVVAEADGQVVGSNILDERSVMAGLGPLTVSPAAQGHGVGRRLMDEVLRRADARGVPGVRLVQSAHNDRSFALYATLGFVIREPLAILQGPPIGGAIEGYTVRAATRDDLAACNAACVRVHGHDRAGEVAAAIAQGSARLVEHDGRVMGYATVLGLFGHAVGDGTEEIKALLRAAPAFESQGIVVPTRNSALLQWCLGRGLRVVQLATLMTRGLYQEPAGGYLASVVY